MKPAMVTRTTVAGANISASLATMKTEVQVQIFVSSISFVSIKASIFSQQSLSQNVLFRISSFQFLCPVKYPSFISNHSSPSFCWENFHWACRVSKFWLSDKPGSQNVFFFLLFRFLFHREVQTQTEEYSKMMESLQNEVCTLQRPWVKTLFIQTRTCSELSTRATLKNGCAALLLICFIYTAQ